MRNVVFPGRYLDPEAPTFEQFMQHVWELPKTKRNRLLRELKKRDYIYLTYISPIGIGIRYILDVDRSLL